MAKLITANNAVTVLDGALSLTDTTLVLVDVSNFPVLTNVGDYCILTLIREADGAIEYVKCTSQNIPNRSYEILRGQEGTVAIDLVDGDEVRNLLTADQIDYIANDISVPLTGNSTKPMTGLLDLGLNLIKKVTSIVFGNSKATISRDDTIDGNLVLNNTGAGTVSVVSGGDISLGTTGLIDCTTSRLTNVDDPIDNLDGANKQYVDETLGSLKLVAWALWSLEGGTMDLMDSDGFAVPIRTATGDTEFTFTTPRANTNYLLSFTAGIPNASINPYTLNERVDQRTVSSFAVRCQNNNDVTRDNSTSTVLVYERV